MLGLCTLPPMSLDEESVMRGYGLLAPVIQYEAIEEGLHRYREVRDALPERSAEWTPLAIRTVTGSHIYSALMDLVFAADPGGEHLRVRQTPNKAAFELFVGQQHYSKFKYVNDDLAGTDPKADDDLVEIADIADEPVQRYGSPSQNESGRTRQQRSPGQVLWQPPLPGAVLQPINDDGEGRLCLWAEYDTTLEDELARPRLTLYDGKKAMWRHFLLSQTVGSIARLSRPLAERVAQVREARAG